MRFLFFFFFFFFLFFPSFAFALVTCSYLKATGDFPSTYGIYSRSYNFGFESIDAAQASCAGSCSGDDAYCGGGSYTGGYGHVSCNDPAGGVQTVFVVCDDCADRCPMDGVCDPPGVTCEPDDCDEAKDVCAEECGGGSYTHTCGENSDGSIGFNKCDCNPDDDGDCHDRRQSCKGTCGSLNASFMCSSTSGGYMSSCNCTDDADTPVDDKDSDGDGVPDYKDDDDDNDGVPDVEDKDDDGDGVDDPDGPGGGDGSSGPDTDGDGVPDTLDNDDDGDGIPDSEDSDQDGDGYKDKAIPLDTTGKTCLEMHAQCEADCDGVGICNSDPESGLAVSYSCTCADGDIKEDGQTDNRWLASIEENTRHTATDLAETNSWLQTLSSQASSAAQQDKDRNLILQNLSANAHVLVNNQGKQLAATRANGDTLNTIAELISDVGGGGDIVTEGSYVPPDENEYSPECTLAEGCDPVPEDTFAEDLSNYISTGIPLVSWLRNSRFSLSSSSPVLAFSFWGSPVEVDFSEYQSVIDIAGNLLFYLTIFSSFMMIVTRVKG